jgi:hypothetical protein
MLESNFLATGNAFGFTATLGLEYFVAPKVSLGLDMSLFGATIGKVKVDDGYNSSVVELEDDEKENISHVDLSAGLRFYF